VVESDLILHVIDVSDDDRDEKQQVVINVLGEIGAAEHPRLTVYNKADLIDDDSPILKSNELLVSAVSGMGLERLVEAILLHISPVKA
jgi:GTP-binding protein HflX